MDKAVLTSVEVCVGDRDIKKVVVLVPEIIRDEMERHDLEEGRFGVLGGAERYSRFGSYLEMSSTILESDPGILTSPGQKFLARFLMSTLHRVWTLAWGRCLRSKVATRPEKWGVQEGFESQED